MNPDNVKIRVENLKKDFGHLKVLLGVSTEICEGEVVVVIGPSGSGKSTFLRCLNQLEEVTGGRIVIDGQGITDPRTDIKLTGFANGWIWFFSISTCSTI